MDWKKLIRFKLGGEDWEMPLNILLILVLIALVLMGVGAWMGFEFGSGTL